MKKIGISLIALVITIAVIIIVAGAVIQNGMQRTEEARVAKHNANITATQEEVENCYYYSGGELPVVNLTPYPLPKGSSLLAETVKNSEGTDNFYILDSSKLGKATGKDGDTYIVSATRHTVYYVEGTTAKGITYHGFIGKNNVKLAQVPPYNNPVVPTGFTHVGTETWDNGFTIEDAYGNQFVWVPALDPRVQANGTLDNVNFNSKFGRRNFKEESFDGNNYYEEIDTNLHNMVTSINKYGGFYIAKYETSKSAENKAQSKADVMPWNWIDWYTAKLKAESMDTDWNWDIGTVESYLCYGAHWDTTLEWLIDSGTKTSKEVMTDSTSWGNYANAVFTYGTGMTKGDSWSVLINTGVDTNPPNRHIVKGIYDLAGNVYELTMENYTNMYVAIRGGHYYFDQPGDYAPAAHREMALPTSTYASLGFRIVLYIK